MNKRRCVSLLIAALVLTLIPAAVPAGESGNERQIELIYDYLEKLARAEGCLDQSTVDLFNQMLRDLGHDPSGRLTGQQYPVCVVEAK